MTATHYPAGWRLALYILRAHVGPFVFSLATIVFLFMLQFVMKFIDQLVGKGLSAWLIMELIVMNLAWMLVLAVPMSVLVATLMAFGDLSARNEVTAMKASGVSIYRMIGPVLLTAVLLTTGLIEFNNHVLPEANHRAKTLGMDIRRKRPTLSLVPGLFSQDIHGYSILVRKTFEHSNDLEGITLYDYTNPNSHVLITAERGTISFSANYRKLIMDLSNGEIHELDLFRMTSYRRLRFENHRILMDVEGFEFERSAEGTIGRSDRELSAQVMRAIVDSLEGVRDSLQVNLAAVMRAEMERRLAGQATDTLPVRARQYLFRQDAPPLAHARMMSSHIESELIRIEGIQKQIDQFSVEIYKKYSIPAACIVFVLIGVPLGIMSRRGGFGIAATLSTGFFVLYWAFLIGGEKLADRGFASPLWGMWAANALIGAAGLFLMVRTGRDSMVIKWEFLSRLLPRRSRAWLAEYTSGQSP